MIIAILGDEKITLEDLDELIEGLPPRVRAIARMGKKKMLDSLLNRRLMHRYAAGLGIGNRQAVKDYVARARREIMIQVAMRELAKKWKPAEKEIRAIYDKNKKKFLSAGMVMASHIMVMSEKEAKDLLVRVKKGADFAGLAKKYSMAPERQKGGSLGKMTQGQYRKTGLPAVIEKTAFGLKAGAHSGVVKSQFGWHIVYTSKIHKGGQVPFGEVRDAIEKNLSEAKRSSSLEKFLSGLRSKVKIQKFLNWIP